MRVLYLVPSSQLGGAETWIETTAKLHHPSQILPSYCLFEPGPLLDKLVALRKTRSIQVHVLPRHPRLRNPATFFGAIFWISKLIRSEKIDLVVSSMAYASLFGFFATRITGKPHLWYQHGPVGSWLDRVAGLLPSRMVLMNSRFTEACQRKLALRSPSRIAYPGVSLSRNDGLSEGGYDLMRRKVRAQLGFSDDDLVCGIICRIQPQKGLEFFIQALQLLKDFPIHGLIVGQTPSVERRSVYEQDLYQLAIRNRLPLKWIPRTPEPLRYLIAMDTVLSTSSSPEGFGLSLLEGMSLGKVPVSADEGGPLEFIQHEENGLLFNSRDSHDLALKLKWLVEHPERKAVLAEKARQSIHERFSAETSVQELESIYLELISERKPSTTRSQENSR